MQSKSNIENLEKRKEIDNQGIPWIANGCLSKTKNKLVAHHDPNAIIGKRRNKDKMTAEDKEIKEIVFQHPKTKKMLTKEDSYYMKFGLLKKACVLYSYDRFKEAFLTIAEAAVIVKAELLKIKERDVKLSKKWKFKLNLPKTFELPCSIETILNEPSVDVKFIMKLELGEVDTAKVILFI